MSRALRLSALRRTDTYAETGEFDVPVADLFLDFEHGYYAADGNRLPGFTLDAPIVPGEGLTGSAVVPLPRPLAGARVVTEAYAPEDGARLTVAATPLPLAPGTQRFDAPVNVNGDQLAVEVAGGGVLRSLEVFGEPAP